MSILWQKNGDIDGFYRYNPHYGWNKLSHDILIQLPKTKVTEVGLNGNKQVVLDQAGYMIQSNDDQSVQGNNKLIPTGYQQDFYLYDSGCVWLSTCFVIRSFDRQLAEYL